MSDIQIRSARGWHARAAPSRSSWPPAAARRRPRHHRRRRSAAASAARGDRGADPARHPGARRRQRARPQRRRRHPLVRRPRRGRPAAADRRARPTFVNDVTTTAQKDVYISLEIYDNKVAANILKTQIAAGNAPDIIGPVGVEGLNLFIDQLADLQPLIDSTGYDMSKYAAGAGRLLQDRQGRRDDRRAVRHLPVVALVQQEAVRRGQARRTRRPRSATCTRASRGTWPPFASSA